MLPYATPEWVEALRKVYTENPENQSKNFKGMTVFASFRIAADPAFGINEDIYFSLHVREGVMQDDSMLLSKDDAEAKSDLVFGATPSVWKKLIRREQGFISLFMTGKIILDKGDVKKALAIAPKSSVIVDLLNKVGTEWPDEMSPQRLEEYKAHVKEFRERLKV
ncbi:MAG: SCP2 sterol-binding domain-containing protein [Deltaproteobacteria bacterium]|nr:SCP2 sterol-binding domain-containing protein [Deltaproteobacteria bacterium]